MHKKIEKAIREKVKFIFIASKYADSPLLKDMPYIVIDSPFSAVIKLSAEIRNRLGLKIVGITGSLGKTTTKDIVFSTLNYSHKAKKSKGNQNTIFPIFNNLQLMKEDTEYFVQEFGAASPGVMPRTVEACIPDAGIITCISEPHLDVFGTKENILKEKLRMIEKMPKGCPAFFNYDDALLKEVELEDHPIISFAVQNKDADYYAENIEENEEYMSFDIVSKDKRSQVVLYAKGTHNVANALVAYAVGEWFGLEEEDIVKGNGSYRSVGIRQNVTNIGGYNLFIDCYNTAPVSLVGAIEVLGKLPVGEGGRRIAVMGDIPRLGEQEKELHIEVAQKLGKTNLDMAFCFGDELAVVMADELKRQGIETYCTNNREQLNAWLAEKITRQDVVLFKGPVVRLLSKTIDQVFGTCLHITSEHFDWETEKDYKLKVIYEKADHDNKLVALMKYYGEEGQPEIMGYSFGAPVFSVGPRCFVGNQNIKVANIPEPIFNIAGGASRNCRELTEVNFPSTLKVIGPNAFRNCQQLESIVIPEGVIEIGENAFRLCKNLTQITIPSTVGRIGDWAFPRRSNIEFIINDNPYAEEFIKEQMSKKGKKKGSKKKKTLWQRGKRKIKRTLKKLLNK